MLDQAFLLYGANGYTGELIARYAAAYGLQPILAGRNKQALEQLGAELKLPVRVFALDDKIAMQQALQEVPVVVNAAGPYDFTAKQLVEACIAEGRHYLDLNGDAIIYDMIHTYDKAAKDSGVMLLPGAGYDVVPTDCLALWLKQQMPDARSLKIAFAVLNSSLSRGTAINTVLKLGLPGLSRIDGKLVEEPVGKRGMYVQFPGMKKKLFTMSLPWGDLSTAYVSTGIPNIETYINMNKAAWFFLKGQGAYNWLLKTKLVRGIANAIVKRQSPGPDKATRDKTNTLIWAQVSNENGNTLTANMVVPEAYTLTALAALLITRKVLNKEFTPGYQTPATAYGTELIMEIPGVQRGLVQ
ncbi:saccharopine dehydrogenase NADP-binding domain-containing protein [Chitinophaga sp.]|uniref:saccharopine dehydrogenase family protein n=1 Tax=Chitinophaga sp. TaxID=1869181 RepID=UPI0031E3A5E2